MELRKKILLKLGLFTRDYVNEVNDRLTTDFERQIDSIKNNHKQELRVLKKEKADIIDEYNKTAKDFVRLAENVENFAKLFAEEKKQLQDRVIALNNKKNALINEMAIKNSEIDDLNKQIKALKEKLSHSYKKTELPPEKSPKQTRTIKSTSRLSSIAKRYHED